jgi:inosine-uridine nucleoside N-ribohydrolase
VAHSRIIIETDIGYDADDVLMIIDLAPRVTIDAILLSPGHPSQVALCRYLFAVMEIEAPPIGVADRAHWGQPITRMHQGFMARPFGVREFWNDGPGHEVAHAVLQTYPEAELLVCGPPLNTGRLFSQYPDQPITRMTIQSGFIGPLVHGLPCIRLPEMENATALPCYNFNADPVGSHVLLHADIGERRLVGRNVCHAVTYTAARHATRPAWPKKHLAARLFDAVIPTILAHRPEKKMHDVVAGIAHRYPELFTWVRGRPFSRLTRDGRRVWGTNLAEDGDFIAIDVDIERFWELYLTPPLTNASGCAQAGKWGCEWNN